LSVSGDQVNNTSTTPLHGTTMANDILTTLSATSGGKTSAQIISVDVFGNNSETTTYDVAAGITLAVNKGANILNISLGSTGDSPILQQVIQQAGAAGIVMYAAAGNQPTGQPLYPAGYSGVIAVTAIQPNGQLAPYANVFPGVQMAAPGTSLMNYA